MKKILIIAILILSYSIMAQAQTKEPKPIIDETYIKTTKTSFTISTVNDNIKNKVLAQFKDLKSYTVVKKKDRMGEYWEYVFRFKLDKQQEIESWLKSI